MKPTLTVFTPTYNRAYVLPLGYEALKRQTSKDFLWLIIDDGSTDNTRELVEGWIGEGLVPIRYHYQQNQGMHGAHNAAYELTDTELNVCIDSDDYMADDAVETIVTFWKEHGCERYAGIIGLDAAFDGRVIGTRLPEHIKSAKLIDLTAIHKVRGDKKVVYRTDLAQKCPPYPLFPGEKYCPLSYKGILIDDYAPLLILNKVLCHVEYLEDGSSRNIIQQYRRNPQGFSFFRKAAMIHSPTLKDRLREAMHYVSSSIMMRNWAFLKESPCKGMTLLALPLGVLFYLYVQNTHRRTLMKNH
ncbi:glycosyltransferase family 2 protein [Paenibacillus gansuensis]|uniref:Glycosyltransferase family 2 protein n=1 Tax=Paenibacillus gansuensis TaxID=306542 RepID=A0ABW5PHH2_9BACL